VSDRITAPSSSISTTTAFETAVQSELTAVEYSFNQRDQIQLERKESMKSRGLASPEDADALALTFAHPVPIAMPYDMPTAATARQKEHDPYAYMDAPRGAMLPSEQRRQRENDPYSSLDEMR
jgi:hypothetical protein